MKENEHMSVADPKDLYYNIPIVRHSTIHSITAMSRHLIIIYSCSALLFSHCYLPFLLSFLALLKPTHLTLPSSSISTYVYICV